MGTTRLCAVGLLTSLLLPLGSSAGLEAHDMWIEPTSFSVDLGRVLGVKLRVGDDFHGEPIPRTESTIDRFLVADANGTREVVGREGADPAGLLRVTPQGRPMAGTRVVAVNQRSPFDRVTGTTDTGGRVRLRLPMSGT